MNSSGLGEEQLAHLYLYTFPAQRSGQGDFGGDAARVQLLQSGPTTFHACQKSFAYSLSFDERCMVKGNVLSPLVYISICSAFCKSPVLCISAGII